MQIHFDVNTKNKVIVIAKRKKEEHISKKKCRALYELYIEK